MAWGWLTLEQHYLLSTIRHDVESMVSSREARTGGGNGLTERLGVEGQVGIEQSQIVVHRRER